MVFLRKTHSRVLREVRYTLTLRYAYGGQGPPWAPLANQPPTPFVIVKRNHAASFPQPSRSHQPPRRFSRMPC